MPCTGKVRSEYGRKRERGEVPDVCFSAFEPAHGGFCGVFFQRVEPDGQGEGVEVRHDESAVMQEECLIHGLFGVKESAVAAVAQKRMAERRAVRSYLMTRALEYGASGKSHGVGKSARPSVLREAQRPGKGDGIENCQRLYVRVATSVRVGEQLHEYAAAVLENEPLRGRRFMRKLAFQKGEIAFFGASFLLGIPVLIRAFLIQCDQREPGGGLVQPVQKARLPVAAEKRGQHLLKTCARFSCEGFRMHERGFAERDQMSRAENELCRIFGKEYGGYALLPHLRAFVSSGQALDGEEGSCGELVIVRNLHNVAFPHFACRGGGSSVHEGKTELAESAASAQTHVRQKAAEHSVQSGVVFFGGNGQLFHLTHPCLSSLPAWDRLRTISASWSGPGAGR